MTLPRIIVHSCLVVRKWVRTEGKVQQGELPRHRSYSNIILCVHEAKRKLNENLSSCVVWAICRFFTQTLCDFAKDFDLEDNSEKFWISFSDIDRIFQLIASKPFWDERYLVFSVKILNFYFSLKELDSMEI